MVNHIPVLLKEVLYYLDPQPGENFIDCTLGFGGHTFEIAKRIAPDGKVLGIELDKDYCLLGMHREWSPSLVF